MIQRISMKHLGRGKRKSSNNKIIPMMKISKIFICQLKETKITIISIIMRHLKLLLLFNRGVNY